MIRILIFLPFFLIAPTVFSAESLPTLDLTKSYFGIAALLTFIIAYLFVIFEEQIHLPKSKPVMAAASIIWVIVAIAYQQAGYDDVLAPLEHNFLEYAELFFFLLVAMTYINTMMERGVFDALRDYLVKKGFSYRQLFWLTGFLAFFISPIADNLTTALILCAVVLAVGKENSVFVGLSCINIVVAANAGGAFSPFGDITTLMVWQKGVVHFSGFFKLFLPSLVNFIVPAAIMHFAIPKARPEPIFGESVSIKKGGLVIVFLFLLTIVTAVLFHSVLNFPPVFGMMTGLAYLNLYAFYLGRQNGFEKIVSPPEAKNSKSSIDIFERIANAEWDTLFFFYGVILSVGGLGFLGYLSVASSYIYGELGATTANILVGVMSAIVDNIPVMFAVLTMNPSMSEWQWLLVTLTAGVGGSLLSIGSAAGVALMGQARGHYTFFSHLKWLPAIALGYVASIGVHWLVNF